MGELVHLTMPDGERVWARVENAAEAPPDNGPSDVGIGNRAAALLGLRETLGSVVSNVRTGLLAAQPDHVTVEFGLELAAVDGGVVAALTGIAGNASVKVTASWDAGPGSGAGL